MGFRREGKRPAGTKFVVLPAAVAAGIAVAYGFSNLVDSFVQHYTSASVATTIPAYTAQVTGDDCLTCHVPPRRGTAGNAYRMDLISHMVNGNVSYAAVDNLDSDGDGVTNSAEATMTRVDAPTQVGGVPQVGYNPGLIDCPPDPAAPNTPRLGYDPVSRQFITNVHETPPGGLIWSHENPAQNCQDGLDNDCDGLTDSADPDCAGPAGCTSNADCQNALFCDGVETCNVATGQCGPGTPPALDDGVDCTFDFCDEDLDVITHVPNNSLCDDQLFCNGVETCNPVSGCMAGMSPCPAGQSCDEASGTCLSSQCTSDAQCDDQVFCNGAETCDPATGSCRAGTPPDLSDGIDCTADSCDEVNRTVIHDPVNALCSDGLYCNGVEICDPAAGCIAGPEPCAAGETCDERNDQCVLEVFDLDILGFRAPGRVSLSRGARGILVVVKNMGTLAGSTDVHLTSVNADTGVQSEQVQKVNVKAGGRARLSFPFPVSLGPGRIEHTVTFVDGDPDDDTATATTVVRP